MASTQICPVVGTTTSVLPPHHPHYNTSDPEARCPVTNAKVGHHDIIHDHPSSPTIPSDQNASMDAKSCPALKNANKKDAITDATCPVIGPVNAHLPPNHPKLDEKEVGKVCPVTNATLEHHKDKVHAHVPVSSDAPAQKCPVAGGMLET
ncbi:hypothetical protein M433DRAFT_134811 [Acidomyces richmondensis BFW]|nr:MAG: hypothetical protein FE78DRAFT_148934 [Acidomyces sp. 'richmondensis']KYG45330.1 hypothetical protein M433DRAFT_134811 [Acidomyces richmondensis BFW]